MNKNNKSNISNYLINSKSKLINLSNSYTNYMNKKELNSKRNNKNNSSIFVYNKNLNSFRGMNDINNKSNQIQNNNQTMNKKFYSLNSILKVNITKLKL